jgi:hypothetical protein
MPARLYTREEFEFELEKAGLVRTDRRTRTGRLWRTPNGRHISVPTHADCYSDILLDDILRRVGRLYRSIH